MSALSIRDTVIQSAAVSMDRSMSEMSVSLGVPTESESSLSGQCDSQDLVLGVE